MKSRSDGTQTVTYDWINNGENRLVGVTTTNGNGTSHQQYIYDASGDRVASIADGVRTNYLVDPMRGVSQVLLEYDANSQITTEYTYGLGLIKSDRSGDENYYHSETGAISLGGNSGSNPRILSNDELQQRAKELHNLLADDPQAFKLRTTAVGRIITSEGEAMTAVSSSSGRFSQAQKGAMEEAREIRVPSNSKFQSHAEQNMIEYGQRKGWTIEAIGVSHPEGICPTCHLRMLQGGITPASNLYVGYKGNIPPSAPLP
ncbi:MAG: hypothetical protein V7K97_18810 [Nostoc sp.]|uniref:hypothetical protein n=1 Tax=Nostoc sp. TaxID=1180 RepID=UPI002FFB90BA